MGILPVCESVHDKPMCGTFKGLKRASGPQELELEAIKSPHICARAQF